MGRRAEDEQFRRGTALAAAGFDLARPDRNTARIYGRVYELPDVTASVMRELNSYKLAAPPPSANHNGHTGQEDTMQTATQTDPNKTLNGQERPEGEKGFFAAVKRQCTVRNGTIAAVVLVLGTAVYFYVTGGTDVGDAAVA